MIAVNETQDCESDQCGNKFAFVKLMAMGFPLINQMIAMRIINPIGMIIPINAQTLAKLAEV